MPLLVAEGFSRLDTQCSHLTSLQESANRRHVQALCDNTLHLKDAISNTYKLLTTSHVRLIPFPTDEQTLGVTSYEDTERMRCGHAFQLNETTVVCEALQKFVCDWGRWFVALLLFRSLNTRWSCEGRYSSCLPIRTCRSPNIVKCLLQSIYHFSGRTSTGSSIREYQLTNKILMRLLLSPADNNYLFWDIDIVNLSFISKLRISINWGIKIA